MESTDSVPAMPGVLFREIHKNGCLKKYTSERRTGFPRKTDKVWAVFCVHDDTEAFLEFYPDHKVALGHKPEWFVSLHNALHVSPSICGQADEFEFAVTLPTQVVRLAAASWDGMMEWVDTIRNKLRELRVLAPKENLYSKMPEPRHALLPTRDPTSPLPLPPVGAMGLVAGIESPSRPAASQASSPPSENPGSNSEESALEHSHRRNGNMAPASHSRIEQSPEEEPRNSLNSSRSEVSHPPERSRELAPLPSSSRSNPQPIRQASFKGSSSSQNGISPATNETPRESVESRREQNNRRKEAYTQQPCGSSVVVVSDESPHPLPSKPSLTLVSAEDLGSSESCGRSHRSASVPSASNVTVIEVPPPPSPHYEHLFNPDDLIPAETRAKLERVSSAGLIPRVPSRATRDSEARQAKADPPRVRDRAGAHSQGDVARVAVSSPNSKSAEPQQHTSIVTVKPVVSKEQKQTSVVRVVPGVSVVSVESPGSSKSVSCNAPPNAISHDAVPPIPAAFQPTPSGLDVRDIPLIGGHQRRRRRSSSSDAGPSQRGLGGADLIRMAPAEAPEAPADGPRLTLRETQVCQLAREMAHPGGVRLPLRRKDCFGAIALVDICNTIWVAGWKQREHPMLYNALHIGDQVVSVGDIPVRTSGEAQKLLRGPAGPTVELVLRRLPRGRVLTLQRPRGGGDVGLVPDATTAGEVSVAPGGVAARAGLPPRTPTMDGLGLTTWSLTEVNGRPLNLFCKPADVTTRLNSVGKELSVLVQPSDFIKQLRKQLKNLKGYKEYLLQ